MYCLYYSQLSTILYNIVASESGMTMLNSTVDNWVNNTGSRTLFNPIFINIATMQHVIHSLLCNWYISHQSSGNNIQTFEHLLDMNICYHLVIFLLCVMWKLNAKTHTPVKLSPYLNLIINYVTFACMVNFASILKPVGYTNVSSKYF